MEKNRKIYFEAIINSVISVLISILITFLIGFFSLEKIEVVINTTKDKENYVTIIEIENYQENDVVENCNIIFEEDINIIDINTNLEESVNNNVIEIKKVYPQTTESILIKTEKELNSNNVVFQIPVKNSIKWVAEEKFSIDEFLYNILTIAITQIIIIAIFNIIMYSYSQKQIELRNQEVERLEKEQAGIIKDVKFLNNNMDMYRNYIKYLECRLMDFSKELDFWKNTIRKAFYNKENIKDSNELFSFVTKKLKTFRTLEKCSSAELRFIFTELFNNENKKMND